MSRQSALTKSKNRGTSNICLGTLTVNETIISNGQLPQTVFLMIFAAQRVLGNYTRNPFKMTLLNLANAKLIAEGQEIPTVPYTTHFGSGNCVREYMDFMKATGYYNSSQSNGIPLKDWKQGYSALVCPAPLLHSYGKWLEFYQTTI